MTEEERYARAKKRVEELRGFYSHAILYIGVMLLLAVLDTLNGGGWWFYWPLLVWGIGLLSHALAVLGGRLWGEGWEERKIHELMEADPPADAAPAHREVSRVA